MARDPGYYSCSDPMCDGDHVFASERCTDTESDDSENHGTVPASLWTRGVWPRCECGYNPHDNSMLAAHYAEYDFREVIEGGQIMRHPIIPEPPC